MDVSPKPHGLLPLLSSQSESVIQPLTLGSPSWSGLACELPQEGFFEYGTTTPLTGPWSTLTSGPEAFPGNEGVVFVCMRDVAAAESHLPVDLKDQASLFSNFY